MMNVPEQGSARFPRRSLLLLGAGLVVGRSLAARAQDQPPAAPAPTAVPDPIVTPAPAASPAVGPACPAAGPCPASPCPVGRWVVSDIGAFIESGLMDVTGVRDLAFRSAEGALRFGFSPDGADGAFGVVTITAEGYRVAVSATVRLLGEVDTAVAFDGELVGRYALAGETLTVSDVSRQDLAITADTPVGEVGIDNDDFFAGGTSRLVCDPTGGTLRLYPDPANEAAIVLTRSSDR